MKHDESLYLRHIVDAIELVNTYLQGIDEPVFLKTSLIQDGVIRQLEIIGEAARHLSKDFRRQFADIPWSDIAGMRDKLIHDYFGVDVEKVWLTAIRDLPNLKLEVQKILDNLSNQ
jgi:uncharacterized protein with HEPN domain